MVYIPGVRNTTSDALSRYPTGIRTMDQMVLPDVVSAPPPRIPLTLMAGISDDTDGEDDEDDLANTLCAILSSAVPITWQSLKEATTSDDDMQTMLAVIEEGFPAKRADTPVEIKDFHIHREHLYSTDGVAVYKDRLVIPTSLRETYLRALHSAHQGITMMTAKAEASVLWPGISADIADHRANCTLCNSMAPSQASLPPTPLITPTRPFQSICADYFHHKGW